MHPFTLLRPASISAAVAGFEGDAAFLAGGHTLIPAMKSRLRAPERLIDLSAIAGLDAIAREGDQLVLGAMATHHDVADSAIVQALVPGLAALAGGIGDPQVRRRGTIGGSLANNDPAADYPAAVLALDGSILTTAATHAADDFFQGMFATALTEGELILTVSIPRADAFAYAKFRHPASRYALAGVAVARGAERHRVAVTGATLGAVRWPEAEAALDAGSALPAALDHPDLAQDIHASADYRAHLAGLMLRDAALQTGVRT